MTEFEIVFVVSRIGACIVGAPQQTCPRWRREYDGMSRDRLKRLKWFELDNVRLRRAVSDLTLDRLMLPEAALE